MTERQSTTRLNALRIISLLATAFLCALCCHGRADGAEGKGPPLEVGFDAAGLKSIHYAGTELLASGRFAVQRVAFRKPDGSTYRADLKDPAVTFDRTARRLLMKYAWGAIACTYTPKPDRVQLAITVTNAATDPVHEVALAPMALKFPAAAARTRIYADAFGRMKVTRSHHGLDAPTIIPADYGSGVVVLCNDRPGGPLTVGLDGQGSAYRVSVRAGGDRMVFDEVYLARPIAPGKSDAYAISLRFGPAGTDPLDLADDICKAYGKAFPMTLKWPDRRPITRLFPAGGLPLKEVIERAKDPEKMRQPSAPDPQFRKQALRKVDAAVKQALALNAQGIIVWEIEGTAIGRITYVGDPRQLRWLNPQMDLVADEFFKRMTDAGLRPGVCIRPTRITCDKEKGTVQHSYGAAKDPFSELDDKIQYAKKRWNCSLFYIDTNVVYRPRGKEGKWTSSLIAPEVWRRLNAKHPDVLLIPELGIPVYHAWTVPYSEMDMGSKGTPEMIRRIWPAATGALQLEDDDPVESHDLLVSAVRVGDIIMTNGGGARHAVSIGGAFQEAKYLQAGPPDKVKSANRAALPALLADADPAVRYYAARAVGASKDPEATDNLIKLLTDKEWVVRKSAVVALGELAAPKAAAPLGELIRDPGAHLDWIAARALIKIGKPAVAVLVQSLEGHRNRYGAQAAAAALGAIGDPDAAAPLAALLAKEKLSWGAKLGTIRALGQIGGPESADALIKVLQTATNPRIRATAAAALARTKDPRAVKSIETALAREKAAENPNRDAVRTMTRALRSARGG